MAFAALEVQRLAWQHLPKQGSFVGIKYLRRRKAVANVWPFVGQPLLNAVVAAGCPAFTREGLPDDVVAIFKALLPSCATSEVVFT